MAKDTKDDKPKKVGRPQKFKEEYTHQCRALAKKGWTHDEMADFLGIVRSTFYKWKGERPAFSDAINDGKQFSDDLVEQSLYQRAVGYTTKQTKLEVGETTGKKETVITTENAGDTAAQIFWLKNRRPDQWRDKREIDNNLGGEVSVKKSLAERLSDGSRD